MERGDRAAVGTFFSADGFAPGVLCTLGESAAHHARVKRLAEGDFVRLTDGAGTRGGGCIARIAKSSLVIACEGVESVPAPPTVTMLVPVADRERLLWLAEKCAEHAATVWQPVRYHRSRSVSPRGEGESFREKVRARMIAALEQSGGAWLPLVRPEIDAVSAAEEAGATRLVCDAAGGAFGVMEVVASPSVVVAVGPEGGFEAGELRAFDEAGWRRVRLGTTILRFETAALSALACVRAAQAGVEVPSPPPT